MKLFQKIRKTLIKEGNMKRYLLYAIGEILLVMIGISLAFQVNNWNDNRIKRSSELRYYENLKNQISGDKMLIEEQKKFNNRYQEQFTYAAHLIEVNDRTKMDSLGIIVRDFTQYSDFDRQGNIYETMVNSGEIKILHNSDIVNGIQYLEEKYMYLNRMEHIHYEAMMKHVIPIITTVVKFSTAEIQKPELIYHYEFQNLVFSLLQIMQEKDDVYNEAINQIDNILELIDTELHQNNL
ncbi:MAG: hypothetical protein COA50_07165 [Flavobacteriaceae bacterium]|nr:MAG: hypothetical protein COA50_07165 [Flavobacteriaceae bacterium]